MQLNFNTTNNILLSNFSNTQILSQVLSSTPMNNIPPSLNKYFYGEWVQCQILNPIKLTGYVIGPDSNNLQNVLDPLSQEAQKINKLEQVQNMFKKEGATGIDIPYNQYKNIVDPKEFVKTCWLVLKELPEFTKIWDYATTLYDVNKEPLNLYQIDKIKTPIYALIVMQKNNELIKTKLKRIFSEQLETA
jgi:hypothetical protein